MRNFSYTREDASRLQFLLRLSAYLSVWPIYVVMTVRKRNAEEADSRSAPSSASSVSITSPNRWLRRCAKTLADPDGPGSPGPSPRQHPATVQKCGLDTCSKWIAGSWTPCHQSRCFTWNTGITCNAI